MAYEGWHRALDVQLGTHKWCLLPEGRRINESIFWSLITNKGTENADQQTREESRNLSDHLIETLWRGDTIFITSEMINLITQAAEDLPDDVTFDVRTIMSKYGFVLLEQPIHGEDRNGRDVAVAAFAWEITPMHNLANNQMDECIMIYYFVDPLNVVADIDRELNELMRNAGIPIPPLSLLHMYPALDGQGLPYGEIVNERGYEITRDTLKMFLAMQMLSHQSIGEPVRMRPDRAARKRFAREYPGAPERIITLITLRRKSAPAQKPEGTVEWSRRWVVRGHWRKQWYPKTKTHGWKYIYEYIKGPDDKPLVTGRRVFNFRR
jgi:hypothetical protein